MPYSPTGWQAVRDEALRRIRTREWAPGARIPDEAELAAELGCARATVNRALRDLAEAGFLDRRRKGGTRVVETPLRKATLEIPVIAHQIESSGAAYGYRLLECREGAPPRDASARLALPAGAALLHVRALHLADGAPHVYEDRWINPAAVPGIRAVDLATTSANAWLVRNVPYTRGSLSLGAVSADARTAAALACPPGSALFVMERITWNGPAPITWVAQHFPPGHRLTTAI